MQSLHGETEAPSFSWTYEEIKEVHKRWWQLRDNAVEIFLTNGRTLLLAFDNTKVRRRKELVLVGTPAALVSEQKNNEWISCLFLFNIFKPFWFSPHVKVKVIQID